MTANASLFCYFCRWRNIHLFESPKLVLRPKLCPLILKITFNSPILDFPLNYLKGLKVYQELKNETIQIRLPGIRQYLWFTCDQQKCQIVLKVYAMKKSHEIMFHILKIRHSTNHDTMYLLYENTVHEDPLLLIIIKMFSFFLLFQSCGQNDHHSSLKKWRRHLTGRGTRRDANPRLPFGK